ncbi:hypothetical protein ACJX0J_041979, partial [Zea mays]
APGKRLDLDADDVLELTGFQSRVQQCVSIFLGYGYVYWVTGHSRFVFVVSRLAEDLVSQHILLITASWSLNFLKGPTTPGSRFLNLWNTNMMFVKLSYCGNSGADKCYNCTLCDELLSILLPAKPPFHPLQFLTCAVVGNSGDLLKTECVFCFYLILLILAFISISNETHKLIRKHIKTNHHTKLIMLPICQEMANPIHLYRG